MTKNNIRNSELRLWYNRPAEDWMLEALPIGNGYMGAMVFGGIDQERIQLNEESLWAGGPGEWDEYNGGNRPDAYKHLPAIRDLLKQGKTQEAEARLSQEMFGAIKNNKPNPDCSKNIPPVENPEGGASFEGYGAYQPCGDIYVDVQNSGPICNYIRELDLAEGVMNIHYQSGHVTHKRQYFASYPDKVMVFNFENDQAGGLDYCIKLKTYHKVIQTEFADNTYILKGMLTSNSMEFETRVLLKTDAEAIVFENDILIVKGCRLLGLIIAVATDYLPHHPYYKGKDYVNSNINTLKPLQKKNIEALLATHNADYKALFNRVELSLNLAKQDVSNQVDHLPTDERLVRYSQGYDDPKFEVLYFNYNRYLLISSSRPGTLPANLQGKWNAYMNPQWACDYHPNINLQMNYWPAELVNLSECQLPLIDYIDKQCIPGRISAQSFFNARGWIISTMNNIFGYTAPGWGLWGWFPAAAGWLCRHLWEHYLFSQDDGYLKKTAYPIMKEAALFWVDNLLEDENGKLVSSPSFSPEHGDLCVGASMDQQIIQDLFVNCIHASEHLGIDPEFRDELKEMKSRLLGPQVGRYGQLQEWQDDIDDPNDKHRHISHLYALYPGDQISVSETPELAGAAKKSLEFRGDGGAGWSLAWKMNFWARLLNGEKAHHMLKRLLKPCYAHNHAGMTITGGTYSNLLCAHPPFQIDGNLGSCAGFVEMLLQSHANEIHLLPALPKTWRDGKAKGLCARGGSVIDMIWNEGKLLSVTIHAKNNTQILLRTPNMLNSDSCQYNQQQDINTVHSHNWLITFEVVSGKSYTFNNLNA